MGFHPIPHDLKNRATKRALGFARDMRRAKRSSLYHEGAGPAASFDYGNERRGEKEPGMMDK
jgi:hypothetical protein